MSDRQPNFFLRLVRGLWGGINGIRKILHLLLLLFVFAIVIRALSSAAPELPRSAALVISPSGVLVEQLAGEPFDRAIDEMLGNGSPETLVKDVVDALEFAAGDDRITAVYLRTDGLAAARLPALKAVAEAIDAFRDSGKPVIAAGDFQGQPGYFLAVHADELYMNPNGVVFLQGYGRFRNFYAEAIEKLSIDWNVFKVGTHKSYVEPYTRNSMSDEDRTSSAVWLNQLWEAYTTVVEKRRGLPAGSIQTYVDQLDVELAKDDGDFGAVALRLNLVDELLTTNEVREKMIAIAGRDDDNEATFKQVGYRDYLAARRALDKKPELDANVAVVVAVGSIVDGDAAPGTIGGESTARLLREARTDEAVKAVVLRVDSGGGSAFASDVILEEVRAIQAAGKPVIASMGGVAASGGYWISMAADQIYADPVTITGSIGILAMIPTFDRTLERIGIRTDGVGTTTLAGQMRPDRPLSDQVKRIVQSAIEDGYDDFVNNVAEYRDMTYEAVDAIAQGKVWSGRDALERGLVDQLGDLDAAIEAAAGLAELAEGDYGVRRIEPTLSAAEQFLLDLFGAGARAGLPVDAFAPRQGIVSKLTEIADRELAWLERFNDPRGMYADCFCDIY
jgi:protease-4